MNVKEIIEAWIIAGHPTKVQKELSEKRLEICDTCDVKKEIIKKVKISHICGKCGCPIQKKAFTNTFNPCPLNKWTEVDEPYFDKRKSDKTLL